MSASTLPEVLAAAATAAAAAQVVADDLEKALKVHWKDYPAAYQGIAQIVKAIQDTAAAKTASWEYLRDKE